MPVTDPIPAAGRPSCAGMRAAVFDLDGTLLDSMAVVPTVYADTIRALGGPTVSPEQIVATWHIGPMAVLLAHFLDRPSTVDDIECYYRHLSAAAATIAPFPGVAEMLVSLRHKGFRLAVYTAATRRAATLMLTNAGLAQSFRAVVGGDEVGEPKPAPLGLLLACRRLGVSEGEAAYVGDAAVDLRCAHAAGSLPIHAAWGASPTATAGLNGHLVARHPGDVPLLLAPYDR